MPSHTLLSPAADGRLLSADATYATALAGSGFVLNTVGVLVVGQNFPASVYNLYQGFVSWDGSALPVGEEITAAVPGLYLDADNSTTDFTIRLYAFDWGATVSSADWRNAAALAGLTLMATLATAGIGAAGAYKDMTPEAGLIAALSRTGPTRFLLVSDRHVAGTAPAGPEYVEFQSGDTANAPRLAITTTAPVIPRRAHHYRMMRAA